MDNDLILSLQINSKQLDSFCKKIISRSRNVTNVHEALVVLEAFISAHSKDSHGSDNYKTIQNTLKIHSDQTRSILMIEKTKQLEQGLLSNNILLLSDIYNSLSRNGFYQILTHAADQIPRSQIPAISEWVISWAASAKRQAEDASGYPDALDFKKANIDIKQYQAMTDIAYFFNNTYI